MAIEFKLPDIGEGVAEGEITKWLLAEGDPVLEDQPMVEVMTDKATVEIPSPATGRIARILAPAGRVIPVGSVLVVIETGAETAARSDRPATAAPASTPAPPPSPAPPPAAAGTSSRNGGHVLAAPATRRLARERGVDLAVVPGTGPRGRITRDDVMAHLGHGAPAPAPAPVATPVSKPAAPPAPATTVRAAAPPAGQDDERIPYRALRKKIGDQMVRSAFTAPHFTYVDEADMTEVVALRKLAAPEAERRGVRLTYLPFIMKALVSALRKHPILNAAMDDERSEIIVRRQYHVGFALDTERGLLVPAVRDVDRKSVWDIAADIQTLSARGRDGSIAREDMTGSTITITSAGSIGGLFATPILNYPEVAILGAYRIKERPVVREGAVVIRSMTHFSVTLDHRVVDGAVAARFMNDFLRVIETPALLALEG